MGHIIRTVEIGFGTTSAIINDDLDILTFKSIVHPVEKHKRDVTSGALSSNDNVIVTVGSNSYEVGPDIDKVYDPRYNRVLNSNYINSEQYKALFLSALSYMDCGDDNTIDFLIGGLPVSNMHRAKELQAFMEGEHQVGDKLIKVKKAWAAGQPLGGLLSYANSQGQQFLETMKDLTILTVDAGYLTLDYLCTTGVTTSDSRSGAVDKGMSKIIEAVADKAAGIFGVDKMHNEVIDKAFYSPENAIKFKGRHYPFPVCKGTDINGEKVRFNYDFTDTIDRVTNEACSAIQNSVGDAQDVDLILVVGGPSVIYKQALMDAYPDHKIVIVDNHLQANCLGLHIAGFNKFKVLQSKSS